MQSETCRTDYGAVVMHSLARQTLVYNSSVTRNTHVSNYTITSAPFLGVVLKGLAHLHVTRVARRQRSSPGGRGLKSKFWCSWRGLVLKHVYAKKIKGVAQLVWEL